MQHRKGNSHCFATVRVMRLDLIRDIRDPEKPETLEQLHIVYEDGVKVKPMNTKTCVISIEFSPTIQHCSLASLIGLYHATFL